MTTKEVVIIIKPEAREKIDKIMNEFYKFPFGLKVAAMEFRQGGWPRERWEEHYAEHVGKPFYEGLVSRMTNQPVTVMRVIITAEHLSIEFLREWVGATDPAKAEDGTLRKKYGISFSENAIHCSDSLASGTREANLWFDILKLY